MTRNQNWLYAILLAAVAALWGCGGGDSPKSAVTNPPVDTDADVGSDSNNTPDADGGQPEADPPDAVCAMNLGGDCSPEGITDPCTGYICHCGHWSTQSAAGTPCGSDAGPDSAEDVVEPDADADDPDSGDAAEDVTEPDANEDADAYVPPDVQVPEEICGNGKDDNGDGYADCQDQACSAEPACQPEVCDGKDNNGNSLTDEGFNCVLGATVSCQTSCGSIGTKECLPGCYWSLCNPPAEVCGNGKDDNCNFATDCDDAACINLPSCEPCDPPNIGEGCFYVGEFSCDPSIRCSCSYKWTYASNASEFTCGIVEVCNGHDDNGNGDVDEGFACVMGSSESCTTSCGSAGTRTCGSSCTFGFCQPPLEVCGNGADDNCNNMTDCQDPVCAPLQECQPEVCNGIDDNNNGQTDEGFQCVAGSTGSCFNSCGFAGTYTCTNSCVKGACVVFENCYAQGDEDCNGKADCEDDICTGLPMCVIPEVCDGLDNNQDGNVDEGFECARYSAPVTCQTQCGSTGTKACQFNCTFATCQPPAENCSNGVDDDCDGDADCDDYDCSSAPNCGPEICDNGVDDDGNNLIDCADPQCYSAVACHDFGTCPTQAPSGSGYSCGTWTQDTVPDSIFLIRGGCANSLNDQWAIGGTYQDVRAVHLTGNHTWNNVPLPGNGKSYIGKQDVICLGQNQTFLMYNSEAGGVILRWNGSSFSRLLENELTGMTISAIWASGPNDIRFTAYEKVSWGYTPAYFYRWDGSALSQSDLPVSNSKVFRGLKFYGESQDLYLAGMEFDPDDYGNPDTHKSSLLHWDGYSWAKVPGSDAFKEFYDIHGSSSCDVLVVGGKHTGIEQIGATFQRNGNQWDAATYDSLDGVTSVVKTSPYKFVLQGHEDTGGASGQIWMGTYYGSAVNWTKDFDFASEGSEFYSNGPTWKVPGTNTIVTAGDGYHGSGDPSGQGTYAFILRSTCQ
ncbi:MAG: MopE-related protein [Patescibacteria group bacterium]